MMFASAKLASPGPSGFRICRRLSERAPEACSILVLSRVSTEARLAAFQAHADDCLEEPLDSRELSRGQALIDRCESPLPFLVSRWTGSESRCLFSAVRARAAARSHLARRYGLSPKQEQIVALVGSGVCLKEVGTACGCLDSTGTHPPPTNQRLARLRRHARDFDSAVPRSTPSNAGSRSSAAGRRPHRPERNGTR